MSDDDDLFDREVRAALARVRRERDEAQAEAERLHGQLIDMRAGRDYWRTEAERLRTPTLNV